MRLPVSFLTTTLRKAAEVNLEALMAGEPFADGGGLVGSVVVHYQMNIKVLWYARLNCAQEFQELATAMAPVQFADHLSGCDVQRGK